MTLAAPHAWRAKKGQQSARPACLHSPGKLAGCPLPLLAAASLSSSAWYTAPSTNTRKCQKRRKSLSGSSPCSGKYVCTKSCTRSGMQHVAWQHAAAAVRRPGRGASVMDRAPSHLDCMLRTLSASRGAWQGVRARLVDPNSASAQRRAVARPARDSQGLEADAELVGRPCLALRPGHCGSHWLFDRN